MWCWYGWLAGCLHMVQLIPLHPKTLPSLASFKSRLVYLQGTGTGLPRLSWKRGRLTGYSSSSRLFLHFGGEPHDGVLPCRRYVARACIRWLFSRIPMLTVCKSVSILISQVVRRCPWGLLQWLSGRISSDIPVTRRWSYLCPVAKGDVLFVQNSEKLGSGARARASVMDIVAAACRLLSADSGDALIGGG